MTTSTQASLNAFYDDLKKHDWYSSFSDDPKVYRLGNARMLLLEKIAKQSMEHQALFDNFKSHFFSGRAWGTEQTPLPVRPG